MKRLVALALVLAAATAACGGGSERVVIAAGTTLVDSGFLDAVVDAYVEDTGNDRPSVLGRSSREVIALGSSGDADLMITHEPVSLYEFLISHPAAVVTEPFASRFVIVAPPGDVFEEPDAVALFGAIADQGAPFVSRDDGSGTHARELALWAEAGVEPSDEEWYVRAGSGMGATLLITAERGAYTLSELGAFLAASETVDLVEVALDSASGLENPYQATVVDPGRSEGAASFQAWLDSAEGRRSITDANIALFGSVVYEVP